MGNQCTCFNSPNNQPTQNLSQLQNPLNLPLNKNIEIISNNDDDENNNKRNENNFIFEEEKNSIKLR